MCPYIGQNIRIGHLLIAVADVCMLPVLVKDSVMKELKDFKAVQLLFDLFPGHKWGNKKKHNKHQYHYHVQNFTVHSSVHP